jgi:hypothetical protein
LAAFDPPWVGIGSRVRGSGFRVLGSGFWVLGSRFWVQGSEFSTAVGLKSSQYNRKRRSEKANIEYRIINVEYRSNVFFLF